MSGQSISGRTGFHTLIRYAISRLVLTLNYNRMHIFLPLYVTGTSWKREIFRRSEINLLALASTAVILWISISWYRGMMMTWELWMKWIFERARFAELKKTILDWFITTEQLHSWKTNVIYFSVPGHSLLRKAEKLHFTLVHVVTQSDDHRQFILTIKASFITSDFLSMS
jgi:hypothetical protein